MGTHNQHLQNLRADMTKFVYDKETKIVIRQTTEEQVGLAEHEDIVECQLHGDTTKRLIYADGVIRNVTSEEWDFHRSVQRERAKDRLRERAHDKYSAEGHMVINAVCEMFYEQLIRISEKQSLESLDAMKKRFEDFIEEGDHQPRRQGPMMVVSINEDTIAKIKANAKVYQNPNTEKYLLSKAVLRAFYNQLVRLQNGEKLDDYETIFETQVSEIIKNWDQFDESRLNKANSQLGG